MNTYTISSIEKLQSWICKNLIPLGFLILLTGMFWIKERSDYHRLFYIFLALPTFFVIAIKPSLLKPIIKNPIVIAFFAFSIYISLSLIWSEPSDNKIPLKNPIYIFLLFCGALLCHNNTKVSIEKIISLATVIAAISAIASSIYFLYFDPEADQRITGYRALYNPLLSSHVYGMFTAIALSCLTLGKRNKILWSACSLSLIIFLILSGSRTPFVGIIICLATLLILRPTPKAVLAIASAITCIALAISLKPTLIASSVISAISDRGLSLRPEIWQQAWTQIQAAPWFGHGFDSPMVFWVDSAGQAFADPHNLLLAVWFSGGIVGLVLWLLLYATCAYFIWKNRNNSLVVLAAATIAFGFAAGMTEGKSFLSRPKEHWFLLWIPFSILAYAIQKNSVKSASLKEQS